MTTRQIFALGAVLLVGLIIGYIAGTRVTKASASEMMEALNLSQSAVEVTRLTMLLRAQREQNPDFAADRMETMLDSAVLQIARDYVPSRDVYESASKALRDAAEYRAAHPYQNPNDSVAVGVREALSRAPTR